MSAATPKSAGWRTDKYMTARRGPNLTARQWRRIRHKYNRATGTRSNFGLRPEATQ